ncbi:hypothetical protein Tco_0185514 [Tanacetum coccineum]
MTLMALSDSVVKTCSKTYLKNHETLKKQYDDLRTEFNKSQSNLANYKRGLASVEEQLVFYKKNEVMLYDQIVVLKRDASFNESKINALKIQIERLKKEKESNQFKINKFEMLLRFEGYGLSANKSVCENSSNETKKNFDAPLIKEWISNNEDEVESPVVVEKKTVVPTIPKVDVVRPKQQEKPVRKTISFDHLHYTCKQKRQLNGQREEKPVWNNARRVNHQNSPRITHPNPKRHMVPRKILTRSGPISLNTARQSHFNAVRTNLVNAGNPEIELEDSMRLNSPKDKKVTRANCWDQEAFNEET